MTAVKVSTVAIVSPEGSAGEGSTSKLTHIVVDGIQSFMGC